MYKKFPGITRSFSATTELHECIISSGYIKTARKDMLQTLTIIIKSVSNIKWLASITSMLALLRYSRSYLCTIYSFKLKFTLDAFQLLFWCMTSAFWGWAVWGLTVGIGGSKW